MPIREAIRQEMARRGWTVYRLCKEAGLSTTNGQVKRYLEGDGDMRGDNLEALLRALGLDVTKG